MSLPSRGAWIEMYRAARQKSRSAVAPLAGSVDRNDLSRTHKRYCVWVAPLAGSVDRNCDLPGQLYPAQRRSPRGERG